jgi:SulP family sulfate permease
LTAVDVLDRLRSTLAERGIVFAIARVKQETRDDLAASGLLDKIGEDRIFMTLPTAVEAYVAWHVAQHGHPPPHLELPPKPPLRWGRKSRIVRSRRCERLLLAPLRKRPSPS